VRRDQLDVSNNSKILNFWLPRNWDRSQMTSSNHFVGLFTSNLLPHQSIKCLMFVSVAEYWGVESMQLQVPMTVVFIQAKFLNAHNNFQNFSDKSHLNLNPPLQFRFSSTVFLPMFNVICECSLYQFVPEITLWIYHS
jgi:hypothetical protein